MTSGTKVELYVFNYLGETVAYDNYCYNSEGLTLYDLNAGDTYEVQIRHSDGYSSYSLAIGKQKEITNISKYTEVNDSIEFVNQRNVYTFTPDVDGRYRFEISGMTSGTKVELYVFDYLGETVAYDNHCYNSEGLTINGLKANEIYTVQVRHDDGFSNYTLSIGKQKPTVDVTSLVKIFDSIQYTGQKNIYNFTADVAGNHTLTINDMDSSDVVELYVYNELGETVKYDSYCKNGDYLILKDLEIGTKYTIVVYQDSGTGNYTLTIE